MRGPLKAGPFRINIGEDMLGTYWLIHRADALDATCTGGTIKLRAHELNQLGRIVEKARKYQNKSRKLRAEREG